MLNVIMLSVVMLNVIMLSAVALRSITISLTNTKSEKEINVENTFFNLIESQFKIRGWIHIQIYEHLKSYIIFYHKNVE